MAVENFREGEAEREREREGEEKRARALASPPSFLLHLFDDPFFHKLKQSTPL